MSYPADALENRHSGIADVQLADLEGNGKLRLYVSYFGVVGLQAASLEGKRLAFNRLLNNVHMAIGPAEKGRRNLVCTNGRGSLAVVDCQAPGRRRGPRSRAAAAMDRRRRPGRATASLRFCCLAGTPQKIGDTRGRRRRSQGRASCGATPCPKASSRSPSNRSSPASVTAGRAGQWLLPGADGSIHILDADGKLRGPVQLRRGAVRPGHRGDRRQAGAGGGHARRRRGLAGGVRKAEGGGRKGEGIRRRAARPI